MLKCSLNNQDLGFKSNIVVFKDYEDLSKHSEPLECPHVGNIHDLVSNPIDCYKLHVLTQPITESYKKQKHIHGQYRII